MTHPLPNDDDNPFRQVEGYWVVRFQVPENAVETAEIAFEDIAVSVSSFEAVEDGSVWQIEALCEAKPAAEDAHSRLTLLGVICGCAEPSFTIDYLEQRDWVSDVQAKFPPVKAGRFYVFGSHIKEAPPAGLIPIQIDAGLAFGSGEHQTTSGCLEALDMLSKQHKFERMLDLGSGSGILAIAMAKLWKKPVLATDIDAIAVKVAEENIHINHVSTLVKAVVSDGYQHAQVRAGAPYDLIAANILARPLIELAPDLAAHLAENGIAILSGLLDRQEAEVLAAHRTHGLFLQQRIAHQGWHTLVLSRQK